MERAAGRLPSPPMSKETISHYGASSAVAERHVGFPIPVASGVSASTARTTKFSAGHGGIDNLRVFKVGSFKDSMGYETTWTSYQLDLMIANFDHLVSTGVFPNVPVRADHSASVRNVVGYIKRLYRDPSDENFLAADLDITEPEAMEKWERGTYRARSLEVGPYETNDGTVHHPVVFGVAFVDIPAVEGLYSAGQRPKSVYQLMSDQEDTQVATENDQNEAEEVENSVEDEATPAVEDEATPAVEDEATPAVVHASAPRPGVASFTLNGTATTDFAAVQAHIDGLEKFRAESINKGRRADVARWAKEGKIPQPQAETLTVVALTMSQAQYDAFASSYEAAPKLGILDTHGAPSGSGSNPDTSTDDDFDLLVEMVKNHKRANLSSEKIAKTPQYAKLVTLCEARNVSITDFITL